MSTASASPLICFHHCSTDVKIICTVVPETCPVCKAELNATAMKIPPFRIPSPFLSSKDVDFGVVIKPTNGSFLR